jgi:hypothetical protein
MAICNTPIHREGMANCRMTARWATEAAIDAVIRPHVADYL